MKLLLGGSPCTNWSIAKTVGRETEPSGIGWGLFENYLIAWRRYRPDYFLYENNKSMAPAIQEQITYELGVEPILINSALVSAQSRQRLYWTNIPGVSQPEDRGLFLRDILESVTICGQGSVVGAKTQLYAVPLQVGVFPNGAGELTRCQSKRIYSIDAKARILNAGPGGLGVQTGLYAVPMLVDENSRMEIQFDRKTYPIYEVRNGFITIKGEQYPIKLADGYYIIRKLTVTECKRLQTVPDSYVFPVSNTQAYKMLGNGWTVDVIAHILSYCPSITSEPVEVLSMYDGMSCGHVALDKLGARITGYYATEIDKYAVETTQINYPETVQLGDAFQVRESGWFPYVQRKEPLAV